MKSFLITMIVFTSCIKAFTQHPDKAIARLRYSFIHIQDTTQKDKPYTENMLLVIGKNASVYTSYDKLIQDNDKRKRIIDQLNSQAAKGSISGSGTYNITSDEAGLKPTSSQDYYFFFNEQKFITKERIFNNYIIEETAPKITWIITKETANFYDIHCQKATTYFKGRNWIAWFAPEFPLQGGPWKLNSLPGLIIEAYDEKKQVQFQFAGMENLASTTDNNEKKILKSTNTELKILGMDSGNQILGKDIKLPTDAIIATRQELEKLRAAKERDNRGFTQAQLASTGINLQVAMDTKTSSSSKNNKVIVNNPIELPEKK